MTALELLDLVDALPTTPLRAAILEAVGAHPGIDTVELADALGHSDPRKALTDLTKMRVAGLLLSRPGPVRGKGQPPVRWRLSAAGQEMRRLVVAALL